MSPLKFRQVNKAMCELLDHCDRMAAASIGNKLFDAAAASDREQPQFSAAQLTVKECKHCFRFCTGQPLSLVHHLTRVVEPSLSCEPRDLSLPWPGLAGPI